MSNFSGLRNWQILSVKDAAEAKVASEKTIRKFVKDGMKILCRNPLLFLGFDLKQHKKAKKGKSSRRLADNEFYCKTCDTYHIIPDQKIKVKKSGKFYRDKPQVKLTAKCPYSGNKLVKFHGHDPVVKGINNRTTDTVIIPHIGTNKQTKIMEFRPTGENAKVLYRFYKIHCMHARGYSAGTIAKIETSIQHFIVSTMNIDFKLVTVETVIQFKSYLGKLKNMDKPISLESQKEYLHYTKLFFEYLMQRPGYKSKINYEMIQCFSLSRKELNHIRTRQNRTIKYPTLEQVLVIIDTIDPENIVNRSHRAMIALFVLGGIRRASLASLRMDNWNPKDSRLIIELTMNSTKNGNYMEISVPPLNRKLYDVFTSYFNELKSLGFQNHHPIFPKAVPRKEGDDICFVKSTDLSREFMSPYNVSRIVKEACVNAGFPEFSVHKLRHTFNNVMKARIPKMNLLLALMNNMGHRTLSVTAFSYGAMSREQQHKLIMEHFTRDPKAIPENIDPDEWERFQQFRKFEEFLQQKKTKE